MKQILGRHDLVWCIVSKKMRIKQAITGIVYLLPNFIEKKPANKFRPSVWVLKGYI